MEALRLRFDEGYREEAELADGIRVVLRRLGPRDSELLARHFASLSAESRHRRFLGAKAALSESELRFYTQIDGEMHFALVAVLAEDPRQAIGIARFIRSPSAPEVAEPAVAVSDGMQLHGLGSLLAKRLAEAALERGVSRFHWDMMSDNDPILRLMHQSGRIPTVAIQGATSEVDLPLRAE